MIDINFFSREGPEFILTFNKAAFTSFVIRSPLHCSICFQSRVLFPIMLKGRSGISPTDKIFITLTLKIKLQA